ncbi:hypothetical protein PARPLA_00716 [Rhodobacteraceae bacterium THAF1]|uniref:trimeric intracellular cation channel family protein n=1 Tax=Palleronia sp. THAF1 TaxID=2587842 RepID=UPI000F3F6476|nr:trimeric intracellular cation channel family protein [Palleronia sp. THAF1]QFU09721.1 hypothetical protein FIU81_13680 [Palleronia sp. THAF1]VDC17376.1 hypothetical protein PARPLA_00716 [Rhodobacteraceae bacterium THAF1]
MTLVGVLDHAAVIVFALTGALTASRAQLDIVGFGFLAVLTGVGGGTLRDVLLDRTIFWIATPSYLGLCILSAVIVFFTAHLLESRVRALYWLDAAALASAVAAGVGVAMAAGMSWPIVLVMGMATGTFGGLMRDVVANEVPLVLKQGEIYATATLAGAGVAVLSVAFVAQSVALMLAAATVFALRAGSIALDWRLPVYRAQAPRDPL